MTVRLSICVPTYNFGPFIGNTLDSIVSQLEPGVEVVVLDGGSTDDTAEVVAEFQRRSQAVHYHRQAERGGIDRDLARTVGLASGDYCWLFCADDAMRPGAISRMLEHLDCGCDLYLCGFTLATPELEPVRAHEIADFDSEREFELSSSRERVTYFERALTTTAFFSFAGSLIFRRQRWDEVPLDGRFIGSLWAHVARFLTMIPQGLRLHYLPDSYLDKRTGNDSFMDAGMVRRAAVAIDGYHRLASTFFPQDSPEAFHMRRVVMREFSPWTLRSLRRGHRDESAAVDRLAAKAFRDDTSRNRINRALYRYTPEPVYLLGRLINTNLALRFRKIY